MTTLSDSPTLTLANSAPKDSMANEEGQVINGIKFTIPDRIRYEVVYNTPLVGKRRIEAVSGAFYNLKVRPYIQGFYCGLSAVRPYWKQYGLKSIVRRYIAVYDVY